MKRWVELTKVNWDHWDLMSWLERPAPEAALKPLHQDAEAFQIRFLEDVLGELGEDPEVLAQLGHLYTEAGRHRDGLAVDRRLAVLRPRDPVAHYNLACSYSLLNQKSRAVAALRKAIQRGYRDLEYMQKDPDLANLRQDPRWADLVSVMNSR